MDDPAARDALSKSLEAAGNALESVSSRRELTQVAADLEQTRMAVEQAAARFAAEDGSHCAAYAGDLYAGAVGGHPVLNADCTVQFVATSSPDPTFRIIATYVPGTFRLNADGTATWTASDGGNGTDTWTYYPTGSSAPVPETLASSWDGQIPGDWRSSLVLVEPYDGKVYSRYQFE